MNRLNKEDDFELLDDTAHPDPSSVPPIILKQRAIASLDE